MSRASCRVAAATAAAAALACPAVFSQEGAAHRPMRAPLGLPHPAMGLSGPAVPAGSLSAPATPLGATMPAACAAVFPALAASAALPPAAGLSAAAAAGSSESGQPQARLAAFAAEASSPGGDPHGALGKGFDGSQPHICAACAPPEGGPAGAPSAPAAPPVPARGAGRLPDAVRPRRYDLRLALDPQAGTFRGRVTLEASVLKPADRIVLHALDLSIRAVLVNGVPLDASRVVVDAAAETVTLLLSAPLPKGRAVVDLSYDGRMSEIMRGLYKSRGKNGGQDEAWSFTHLEPTHARRVLPSFDEPAYKASFRLTLDVPEGLTAISNMPAVSQASSGGRTVVAFAESPRMSSYLLAVFAARLAPKSRMVGPTKVTVWAPAGQLSQADFALDVAEMSLKGLERYFGLPYQLPKLDLVAAPDFASGAMENWGAILFRDASLLVDPALSSEAARRRVADVVAHEIAHQWFGNLVTMKWWNDLWLNEAFATWIASKIVDGWKPDWKMWEDFDRGKRGPLGIDALPATRPVRSDAATPAEIQAMFDPITYDKGGALLRMLESWIGEKDFRRGIQAYMRRFPYKNAEAGDLWRELESVSGKPVRLVARGWLSQGGVPIVRAEALSADGRTLRLRQERFSAFGGAEPASWSIPVVVRYRLKGEQKTRVARALLDGPEKTLALPGRGPLAWAYPNAGEVGYYRLGLDARLLAAATAAGKGLTPTERSGLLNHLWAGVRAGAVPVSDFLETLWLFRADRSRLVLEDAAGYLKALRQDLAASQEERDALGAFAEDFFLPHARRLGWESRRGEGSDSALARPAVLGALTLMAPAASFASKISPRLEAYLKNPGDLEPAIAPVVLTAAARGQAPRLFEAFRQRLASPKTPEQKEHMLRALAEFSAPELEERYLAMTLSDEIRPQDAWKPFQWLLGNPQTRPRAWAFVKAHWPELAGKLGPRGATRVIGAAAGLVSEEGRRDVESFFREPGNEVEMARKTLEQALSSIDLGLRFKKAQRESFTRWLKARASAR